MDKRVLKELQKKELECALEVKRICVKNNITWSLGYGSILGAVRHHGFIPWDDDMDILMFESEFSRFKKACETDMDTSRFFLQTTESDWNYPYTWAKMRMNDTCSMEEAYRNIEMHWGICIDIFVIRNAPENSRDRRKLKFIWKWNTRILGSSLSRFDKDHNILKSLYSRMLYALRKENIIVYLSKKIEKMCSNTAGSEVWVEDERNYLPASLFQEVEWVTFEGELLSCLKQAKRYCELQYGNYMKYPEESERGGHEGIIVDTVKDYKEYQK